MSKFIERYSRIKMLNGQITSLKLKGFNWDTLYREEALRCFHRHLPISSILISSALVESCLFWVRQRRSANQNETEKLNELKGDKLCVLLYEWIDSDIPLEELLDADEDLEYIRNNPEKMVDIKYVLTRNLFAHGNIIHPVICRSPLIPLNGYKFDRGDLFYPSTYLKNLLPYNKKELLLYGIDGEDPILDTIAYVHLTKSLRFMKGITELA